MPDEVRKTPWRATTRSDGRETNAFPTPRHRGGGPGREQQLVLFAAVQSLFDGSAGEARYSGLVDLDADAARLGDSPGVGGKPVAQVNGGGGPSGLAEITTEVEAGPRAEMTFDRRVVLRLRERLQPLEAENGPAEFPGHVNDVAEACFVAAEGRFRQEPSP